MEHRIRDQITGKYVGKPIRIEKRKNGCHIITSHKQHHSGYVRLIFDKAGQYIAAHRYFYSKYKGPIPKGMCVLHACDIPQCVNPEHLFLGTRDTNNKDRAQKLRSAMGMKHPHSKLTDEDIRDIRSITEISDHKIARIFKVDPKTIFAIKNRNTWKHIE